MTVSANGAPTSEVLVLLRPSGASLSTRGSAQQSCRGAATGAKNPEPLVALACGSTADAESMCHLAARWGHPFSSTWGQGNGLRDGMHDARDRESRHLSRSSGRDRHPDRRFSGSCPHRQPRGPVGASRQRRLSDFGGGFVVKECASSVIPAGGRRDRASA